MQTNSKAVKRGKKTHMYLYTRKPKNLSPEGIKVTQKAQYCH